MTTLVDRKPTASPGLPVEFVRFVVVGVANFGLFALTYLLLRLLLDSTAANIVASLLTTITNTGANGRITFGAGEVIGLRVQVKGLAVTALGLVITTTAVDTLAAGGSHLVELVVLTGASAVSGGVRFLLLRHWVFGPV
jgi:putative flippase GtrA